MSTEITVSGWTVTNGRSFLGSILDERDIDQLTQRILTAIDRLPHTFASRSGDLVRRHQVIPQLELISILTFKKNVEK